MNRLQMHSGALLFAIVSSGAGVGTSLLLCACGEGDQTAAVDADGQIELHTYTVRGIVQQLPSQDDPRAAFMVRHEEIPEFRGQGGAMGMPIMTMEFPLAQGVSIEGVAVGDILELVFVVRHDPARDRLLGYETIKVTKLPDDTALNLSE